jgi:uncharacterized protein YbjT (DUF2867 family)
MRVIVIGATGNVRTSVLRSLENEDQVDSVLGLAPPHTTTPDEEGRVG